MDKLIAGLLKTAEKERDDHVRFTSAIAFCLSHEEPKVDEQLLRLAALSHEKSGDEKEELKAEVPDYADFLSQAWEMLEKQKRSLDRTASPTDFVPQPPDDDTLAVLYWAHIAASERMGGKAVYTDREGNEVSLPTSEEIVRHPLRDRGEVALIYGGATKIKGYVFESARLPEVRGASALFDRINLEDVPALWGQQNEMAGEILAIVQAPECVIYASGGNFLAFAPVSKAAELANAVEKRYTTETLVGNSVAVWQAFTLLELQYGRHPDVYWYEDYERDMQGDLKPILEAYYSYPEELDPGSLQGRFYQRKAFGELVTVLANKMMCRRGGWGGEGDKLDEKERDKKPKRLHRHIPHFELLPYAVKCHSCDVRPAVVVFRAEDTSPGQSPRIYCEPCARKRVTGQVVKQDDSASNTRWFREAFPTWWPKSIISWERWFLDFLDRNPESRAQYFQLELTQHPCWRGDKDVIPANDLHEIGRGSNPERYIGLIYADGNNVGAQVARLRTPAEYSCFSRTLFEATRDAVFAALAEHLTPVWIESAVDPERPGRARIWIHPFEIITIGGDDLILIVPGSKALDIALSIGERLERILGKKLPEADQPSLYNSQRYQRYVVSGQRLEPANDQWPYEPTVSLSAGVVIAHETTPIFFLHDLAEQLQKSAKRWRKQLSKRREKENKPPYKGGTVDFLALKSIGMVASRLNEFRERALVNPAGHHLTARPYTWIELRGLLETVRALQNSGFARSQIFRMQDYLAQGLYPAAINYLYNFVRLQDEGRWELARAFHFAWHHPVSDGALHMPPWRYLKRNEKRKRNVYETVWRDLVEIYDFVK